MFGRHFCVLELCVDTMVHIKDKECGYLLRMEGGYMTKEVLREFKAVS